MSGDSRVAELFSVGARPYTARSSVDVKRVPEPRRKERRAEPNPAAARMAPLTATFTPLVCEGGEVPPFAEVATLVIDCAEVEPMVRMYRALGAKQHPRYGDQDCLLISGLTISFQTIEGYTAPTWPARSIPKMLHLDFFVDSVEEMEHHLHLHGAVTAEWQPHRVTGLVVMLDPAGHPFCIGSRV